MKAELATITSKGQVTVPAAIRKALNLKQGTRVRFILDADGVLRISVPKYTTIEDLRGAAGTLKHPKPWRQVLEEAREDGIHLDDHDDDTAH